MIVLGGGPVGSELSQAWACLGTKVTLVEGEEHLLSRDEPFAGEEVADSLRGPFGVDVRTGALVEKVSAAGAGVVAQLSDGGTVAAAEILVAVGRVPHTGELNLAAAGVEAGEHGFLATDDRLRVGGRDWLYAIGDVNGRALFTHIGKYQAWVAAENLLGREVAAVAEAIGPPGSPSPIPRSRRSARPSTRRGRRAWTRTRSTSPPTAPPAPASKARTPAAPRGSSSTGTPGRSSAPPSAATTPPTSCRRRRSRSSPRSRSRAYATRSPPIRRAARSG